MLRENLTEVDRLSNGLSVDRRVQERHAEQGGLGAHELIIRDFQRFEGVSDP